MKGLTKSGWLLFVAILTALVGMILYIITSTTGYLAGSALKPAPILMTVVALILACALVVVTDKLQPLLTDLFVVASTVLLIFSFALFTLGRVSLAADVYFIPVNYPQAEEIALNISVVGVAFYLISIIAMIVVAFCSKIRSK